MRKVTYGFGGYCENCDESHDHPFYNILEDIDIPDDPELPVEE